MHAQRRVSLPAPARTTRMNGGPRLRAPVPLPPFWPGAERLRVRRSSGASAAGTGTSTLRPSGPPMEEVVVQPRIDPARPVHPPRTYAPPAIVEESPTFPIDAFIIPEGAARLPRGVESDPSAIEPPRTPGLVDTAPLLRRDEPPRLPRGPALREQRAHDVADRLEALAAQLRNHGYEVLAQKSVRGDPLDALLAGVIAGYLVAAE